MKRLFPSRLLHRLNAPVAVLLALLQRTPVVRVASQAATIFIESPVGTVLRSVLTAAASLGAIESMAGATPLVATPAADSSGLTATVGTSVSVFYTVTGTQTPPASWQVTGTIPPGLSFSGLTGNGGIVNVTDLHLSGTPTTAGTYDMTITTYQGTNATLVPSPDYSYTITVTSGSTATAPVFTTDPQSQTVNAGAAVTFTAAASGSPAPTYQWQKNGVAITGATSATFTLGSAAAGDAGSYVAVATNSAGTVSSKAATLTVNALTTPPSFTTQPASEVVVAGGSATFNAAASGTPAPTYQWQKNGVNLANGGNISGATSGMLTVSNVGATDAANYAVVAANSAGSVTSNAASITLGAATDQGHISNMSVLTSINGGETFKFGYFVGGSGATGTKPILMRAMGPTLVAYGVGDALADPALDFFNDTTVVSSNDNWGGDASIRVAAAAVGAFPFAADTSKDAAIYNPAVGLAGGHSIQVSGVNGSSGTVLAELYDATPGNQFTSATPRLTNVSLLKNVGAVTTLGFYIAGASPVKVLIRAIGPTIGAAPYNVPGVMADPQMSLFVKNADNTSTMIATNDNWGATAELQAAFAATSAFSLDPSSKDAALVQTLQPGGYSVQVSPSTGATGLALIEVYVVGQ